MQGGYFAILLFGFLCLLTVLRRGRALDKCSGWGPALHAALLVRPAPVAADQVVRREQSRISSTVSNLVRWPSTRKCSSGSMRCSRSTMPQDCSRFPRLCDGRCPRAAGTARRDTGRAGRGTPGHCRTVRSRSRRHAPRRSTSRRSFIRCTAVTGSLLV